MKNISDNDFVFEYSRILFLYGYTILSEHLEHFHGELKRCHILKKQF